VTRAAEHGGPMIFAQMGCYQIARANAGPERSERVVDDVKCIRATTER